MGAVDGRRGGVAQGVACMFFFLSSDGVNVLVYITHMDARFFWSAPRIIPICAHLSIRPA